MSGQGCITRAAAATPLRCAKQRRVVPDGHEAVADGVVGASDNDAIIGAVGTTNCVSPTGTAGRPPAPEHTGGPASSPAGDGTSGAPQRAPDQANRCGALLDHRAVSCRHPCWCRTITTLLYATFAWLYCVLTVTCAPWPHHRLWVHGSQGSGGT